MASTTTRLRKTFKYPSDDEHSTGSHDELDEEEQDDLISSLENQSKVSNATYTIIFTILPLTLTPLFTYHLVFNSSLAGRLRMLSLLGLTSLLASSFTMCFLSRGADMTNARDRLDRRQRQVSRRHATTTPATTSSPSPPSPALLHLLLTHLRSVTTSVSDKLDDMRMGLDREGPLLQALPVLNYLMSAVLLLAAYAVNGGVAGNVSEYMWLYFLMPPVMTAMTAVARSAIMDEERGIAELGGLRYGYKGA